MSAQVSGIIIDISTRPADFTVAAPLESGIAHLVNTFFSIELPLPGVGIWAYYALRALVVARNLVLANEAAVSSVVFVPV